MPMNQEVIPGGGGGGGGGGLLAGIWPNQVPEVQRFYLGFAYGRGRKWLVHKILVIRTVIHKVLVRIANREYPDQTASLRVEQYMQRKLFPNTPADPWGGLGVSGLKLSSRKWTCCISN